MLVVNTCDLTVVLNMFHGTHTLPTQSPKCRQMDLYEKVAQKRFIPKNYQVIAIVWFRSDCFLNDSITLEEIGKNF